MAGRMLYDRKQATYIALISGGMKAPPMFIADAFGVSPERVEKLLVSRGQYDSDSGETILEAVRRNYGVAVSEWCEEATT